jgi:predicted nuclease of restriction endonuclease-like (RecB) superfamily
LLRQQTLLKGAADSPFLQSNSPFWSARESDRRNIPRRFSLARSEAPSEALKGEFHSVFLIAFGSNGALNPFESNIVGAPACDVGRGDGTYRVDELLGPGLDGYQILLRELKERIRTARLRAALAVNEELVLLYWGIGREILARQAVEGWGSRVIDRLSADLRRDFPDMTGLSPRNLKYMRTFAEAIPDREFVQQVVARLPWGHVVRLLETAKDATSREWYARQAIENGWSRNVLVHQIEGNLYERQGKALTNFSRTLPPAQSELAQQLIKDPYSFDFLTFGADVLERDLERGLLEHLRLLILELGKGFAFVGSQYHLSIADQDFYLDLLFYHLRLRCFVVIDLKIEEFKPEFAGKMNFYLSAVDDHLRHPDDSPSIGIILCKSRNELIVEYALRDTAKPMGVARYRLSTVLPDKLREDLPTLEDFARELPDLSFVALQIEIERKLRELMISRGLHFPQSLSISQAVRLLKESGVELVGTDSFLQTLAKVNKTAHGLEIEPSIAAEALRAGSEFLSELRLCADQESETPGSRTVSPHPTDSISQRQK